PGFGGRQTRRRLRLRWRARSVSQRQDRISAAAGRFARPKGSLVASRGKCPAPEPPRRRRSRIRPRKFLRRPHGGPIGCVVFEIGNRPFQKAGWMSVRFALIYSAAWVSAFATALLALPLWRKWCLRTGLVDDPGHRKIHDQAMPLAGGLAFMTSLAIPTLLAKLALFTGFWSSIPILANTPGSLIAEGVPKRSLELGAIFVGAIGILLVGLWDDKHESRPAGKFICQFAVAALVAASGARITLFVHSTVFSFAITILWILTVINA